MIIKIHFYLFAFLAYTYFIGKFEIFLLFYLSILFHEISHIVISLLLKVDVKELNLMPFGVCAVYSDIIKPWKEIIISLAGPIASFIIFLFSKNQVISNINLIIFLVNMIPIYPLDGGRIQKSILLQKYGYKRGLKLSEYISDFFIVLLFLFSIFFIIYFENFYLLFFVLYLLTLSKKEIKKEKLISLINYLQTDEECIN